MNKKLNTGILGGKAESLVWLKTNGFPAPNFLILSYLELNQSLNIGYVNQLVTRLESALLSNGTNVGGFYDANLLITNFTAEKLRNAIRETPLGNATQEKIRHAWETGFFNGSVAVRSSAKTEDSRKGSSAGQYETILGISSFDDLLDAIREVQSSYYTARAIRYRAAYGLPHALEMSVIIQDMVPAIVSGIAFSKNPVTKENYDSVVINAGWGLGDMIVGGEVQPDEYVIDAHDFRILSRHAGSKRKFHAFDAQRKKAIEQKQRYADYCLDDESIIRLSRMVVAVEEKIGYPVDIEWVASILENETLQFFLVQARPITTA